MKNYSYFLISGFILFNSNVIYGHPGFALLRRAVSYPLVQRMIGKVNSLSAPMQVVQVPDIVPSEVQAPITPDVLVKNILDQVHQNGTPVTINVIHAPDNKGQIGCSNHSVRVSSQTHHAVNSFNKQEAPVHSLFPGNFDIKSCLWGAGAGAFILEAGHLLILGRL